MYETGLESREYGRRDPSRWPYGTLYPQKLALTSQTSGYRSVGIVRSRTQATVFFVMYENISVKNGRISEGLSLSPTRKPVVIVM
jgi:hypothetical protein